MTHINPARPVVKVRVYSETFGVVLTVDVGWERYGELRLQVGDTVWLSPRQVRVFVALGQFAYVTLAGMFGVRPRPPFGHGVEVPLGDGRTIICSYHPSQQNTFTGKLTQQMFDGVFQRAKAMTSPAA